MRTLKWIGSSLDGGVDGRAVVFSDRFLPRRWSGRRFSNYKATEVITAQYHASNENSKKKETTRHDRQAVVCKNLLAPPLPFPFLSPCVFIICPQNTVYFFLSPSTTWSLYLKEQLSATWKTLVFAAYKQTKPARYWMTSNKPVELTSLKQRQSKPELNTRGCTAVGAFTGGRQDQIKGRIYDTYFICIQGLL